MFIIQYLPIWTVRRGQMIELYDDKLYQIDKQISSAQPGDIPRLFRDIPIDIFGLLLLDIPSKYPNIKSFFPTMASEEAQKSWTGNAGQALLSLSLGFMASMLSGYKTMTHKELQDSLVLDFGCGWGRLIRLLYKYVSFENIYAVDPLNKSIEICRENGVKAHLALSEYVPSSLPFGQRFDLIYAFSVFTHLSEKTTHIVLKTLRKYIVENGALVITIRPEAYWNIHEGGKKATDMIKLHDDQGFAFIPHQNRAPIDGDITYGDTSMTLNYLERNFPEWKITNTDSNSAGPYQMIVFLKPR
jgi:SAM-dependent methyltransferase